MRKTIAIILASSFIVALLCSSAFARRMQCEYQTTFGTMVITILDSGLLTGYTDGGATMKGNYNRSTRVSQGTYDGSTRGNFYFQHNNNGFDGWYGYSGQWQGRWDGSLNYCE